MMNNTAPPVKQTACIQTFRGTARWAGSQLLGSLSKNFKEVVRPFSFVFQPVQQYLRFCRFFDPVVNVFILTDSVSAEVKTRPQLQQELFPVEINTAASQLQTGLLLSCHSSLGLRGAFAEKCTLNARPLSFLLTLCSLSQRL